MVTQLTPWPRGSRPRYAAVSSFGVSGTNAHLVVGEAPVGERPAARHAERTRHVLIASAKDRDGVQRFAKRYGEYFAEHPDLNVGDACFTANTGRGQFRHRLAVVGGSLEELSESLLELSRGGTPRDLVVGQAPAAGAPRLAFLFTGQGSQHVRMGRSLYDSQPAFRTALRRCDEILRGELGQPLLDVIYPEGGSSSLDDTTYTQPALFAIEYALAEMWRSWGVEPDVVLGHSVGEYAAACVAGVFSLEDGLRLIAARGRLMGALPREGTMIAIPAGEAAVARAVEPYSADVSVAALNGPESVVISGRAAAVQEIARGFEAKGIAVRPLKVSHAFHSPLMEPMLSEFEGLARRVTYSEPRMPMVSNLTGSRAGADVATPEYWTAHVRKPVRFADGLAALEADGISLFLEVGPRPMLSAMGAACLSGDGGCFLPSMQPGQDEWDRALLTLAELFVRGVRVDWKAFDDGYGRAKVALPYYPPKGMRYFVDAPADGRRSNGNWLEALLEAGEKKRLVEQIRKSGRFSDDEARLLGRLLEVFAEEYRSRLAPRAGDYDAVVAGYYDGFRNLTPELEHARLEEITEAYLTFAPLPDVLPGYSWVLAFADGDDHPERARMTLEAQQYLREAVFRKVDFSKVKRMLDFGCGYGSDLCTLALRHPHLEGTGYTLSVEQMKVGHKKVERLGLTDRVRIFNSDSTKDEFPGTYELAFGFEVAHHVPDKQALFSHISRHLAERGQLTMADFISRTGFAIEYDTISSYFPTPEEWVDLFSDNQLLCVDLVDISREMANFLYDPDFDSNVEQLARAGGDPEGLRGLKSYDRLGKLHAQGLALYALFTAEKRSDLSVEELRELNRKVLAEPTPYSEISIPHGCYEVEWVRRDRSGSPRTNGSPLRWLVLADRGGVGDALIGRLEGSGQQTVRVAWGGAWSKDGASAYTVDPSRREDFERLLGEAGADGPLHGIVHLWSLDAPSSEDLDLDSLRETQRRGCGSAISLTRALGEIESLDKPRIWLVTRQAQPVGEGPVEAAPSPLLGVGRGIALELPELWGGMLDLEAGPAAAATEAILAELAGPDGEFHVAYRGGERFVPRLTRRSRPPMESPAVRGDATYLVTGGTGGLGLEAARWLVGEGARHLVLSSRRGAGEPARQQISKLESQGAEVRVVTADVRDEEQMRSVVDAIGSSMPPLRGVIHAAGIYGGTLLAEQDWEGFEEVVDIKVAGSWILHDLTRELPLDFFVCVSSAASVVGAAGRAAYGAANHFKDALCHHRARVGLPATVVNWGPWGEVGMMVAQADRYRKALHERGMGLVDPVEGTRVLGALIAEGRTQSAVMQINWPKFFENVSEYVPPFFERVAPRSVQGAVPAQETKSDLGHLKVAPREEQRGLVDRYLLERVARIVGYPDPDQVDREVTLLELGFDSLMAVQLRNAIRTDLEVDLPVGKLFDTASVESLTELIQEKLAAGASGAQPPATGAAGDGAHVEVI